MILNKGTIALVTAAVVGGGIAVAVQLATPAARHSAHDHAHYMPPGLDQEAQASGSHAVPGPPPKPTPTPLRPTPTALPNPTLPPPTSPTTTSWKYTESDGTSTPAILDTTFSPNSNGYNTYVENQDVGQNAGSNNMLYVISPSQWKAVVNDVPYGYTGIQTFTSAQQLFNNYKGGSSDYPVASLSSLMVSYSETSPTDANSIYEFAPDVWTSYGQDVMFWVDTSHTRCVDNGMNTSNIIGQANLDGRNWTVYRDGGPGSEIIFILDGSSSTDPVDSGSCATQTSGTIDVDAGLHWLSNDLTGFPPWSSLTLSMMNTGWEITSADNTTFTVNSMSYEVSG